MLWYSPMNLLVRNLTARADLPTWDPPTTVTFTLGLSFSLWDTELLLRTIATLYTADTFFVAFTTNAP